MRRGLTLIELTLTVGLLTGLAVALSSWLAVTSRSYAEQAQVIQWRAAAEAALRVIGDDLAVRDFETDQRDQVEIRGGALLIRTRTHDPAGDPGPVLHEYEFDPALGELRRSDRGESNRRAESLLLDDVADVQWTIDEDRGMLSVRLRSHAHGEVARLYRLQ